MVIAVLAGLAMAIQDLLAVSLVQAEARNRAVLAGVLDCLMWPAQIFCTYTAVTAFQGHHELLKGMVIAMITIANFAGSYTAVRLGKRWIREEP